MRDLLKLLVVGIVFFMTPQVFAESYKVLVVPDNLVTETVALDSYIYNATSEFFADDVITILNGTDYIKAPSVSETRVSLKSNPNSMLVAKDLTAKFRTSYNVDYVKLKKIASKTDSKYVLLITSHIDAENYILRRTVWDFLNVAGATVVDPAYKISTYAVLVDTENNAKLWSDTYYKAISVCENRIITRGASPQTEQLQKIKDYSRYLTPQIAQNVQLNVLPADVYEKESKQVYYDMGNIDNVFTKKYRHIGKEYDKVYQQRKTDCKEFVEDTKVKVEETSQKVKSAYEDYKQKSAEKKALKSQPKMEVKAEPLYNVPATSSVQDISNDKAEKGSIFSAIFKKKTTEQPVKIEQNINYYDNSNFIEGIDIKRKKKNNLYGDYESDRPELRDYYN